MSGFTARHVTDQSGKTFVVTGANAGIGLEAANILAARGARVLLACRSEDKAREAMRVIDRATPGADLAFLPLDLADLESVRRAAEIASRETRIDVLLNNAGVMFPPLQHTEQGFELQWGVNHLGPFALTNLLLSKLAETQGARVVVTSSLAHRRGKPDWDDPTAGRSYNRMQRYSDSKLANLLHVYELDRRLRAAKSPVTAVACHPGVASTELTRYLGPLHVVTPIMGLVLNTSAQGAWPALQAATAPRIVPGEYYGPQRFNGMSGASGVAERTATATNPLLSRLLWEVSVEATGIDPGLAPV